MPIFEDLENKFMQRREFLGVIGVAALRDVSEGFTQEKDPDGKPWAALNPEYAKRKEGPSILSESGSMERSVYASSTFNEGAFEIIIGPDADEEPYYEVQHTGGKIGKGAKLPSRKYVGANREKARRYASVLLEHLKEGLPQE